MNRNNIKDNSGENVKSNKKLTQKRNPPGLLSRITFFWVFRIFYIGNRRDLQEDDLVPARRVYNSKTVGDKLEKAWLREELRAKEVNEIPMFRKALFNAFFWSYMPAGLMQFMSVSLRTLTPVLFGQLLSFWSPGSKMSRETAACYAAGLVIGNWIAAFFTHHGRVYCQQFGMKIRIAISSMMFRKIMRMDHGSLGETTAGKVVNLLSNDLDRCDQAFLFLHYVWILPVQLVAICYLGYLQAGYAALIGIASLLVIAAPAQGGIGNMVGKVRSLIAERTDARIKIMSEIVSGIQVIKMYAWEIPFERVVEAKRSDEMNQVRRSIRLRAALISFMVYCERTAIFITVLTLILLGNTLSANTIYPLQQFLSAVQLNLTFILPLLLSSSAEFFVTLRRIQEFMVLRDRQELKSRFLNISCNMRESEDCLVKSSSNFSMNESPAPQVTPIEEKYLNNQETQGGVAIELRDVCASWLDDPNVLALKKISLRIRKNNLCAVIGAVGSGKSSFLQLLLRELPISTGTMVVNGNISYACQEPWLFSSTVRENILFGLAYDQNKYKQVCKVCALEKDFRQFPYSDQTLVGERGVSLSGGQRARINLARAVYREADIYLLDDPLSAVDANVGRQLFEGCINGYLRGRTRILVTHQIHFLKGADYIVVLNEGVVENMGTFDELVASGSDFTNLLAKLEKDQDKDVDMKVPSSIQKSKERARSVSISSDSLTEQQPEYEAQVMKAEERQSGGLKWAVFSGYFLAGSHQMFVVFTFFMIFLANGLAASVDYWISYWTNQIASYEKEIKSTTETWDSQVGQFKTYQYLMIHGILISACIVVTITRIFPFAAMCASSSHKLHNRMFAAMLRGVMRFFDTSSSGRILNRFAKDMGALDEVLPRTFLDVCQIYSMLAAVLILNAIALYWTIIPSLFLLLLFYSFLIIYMKAAQGIKRIEGTTKSPVFGMVTTCLNGISTIRVSGAQNRLIHQFDELQDIHTSAWNSFICGGTNFGFYLDTMCLTYLAIIIVVFLYIGTDGLIAAGSVGLAVTQSNTLTALLQFGARTLVEFIAQLTSVERVLEYTRIETEKNLSIGDVPTPSTWPTHGKIVFSNVYLRYAPEEAPVLKNLNISIDSGWKVGIVGRTGAGKSSLISALFRFADIDGKIFVDDLDTSMIARQDLRSKISIIPQEPVLFSATIRYNLDPFNIYSDSELWNALESVDLKNAVPSLDFKVTEGGSNFSVGQRQLMCLARAVLRSNKILIMDEATANVDPQTDNFIQQTIRRQFASCTVLTIAHRLNTIMDSDKVLVMDSGQAVEFDHPYVLLSNPDSVFSSMVRETGDNNSAQLYEVAKEAYLSSNLKQDDR